MSFKIRTIGMRFIGSIFCILLCAPLVAEQQKPKNIILMIGDGMGPGQIKALRMVLDSPKTNYVDPLSFERHFVGTLATDPIGKATEKQRGQSHQEAVYLVTDSASSATAYSTGSKTFNGAIAINDRLHERVTILEHAKKRGKKTGLVATSQITHATPAAFIAHVESRREYNAIADAFLDNRLNGEPVIDVFLGGGLAYFQRDDRNLINELEQLNYQVVINRQQLNKASGKIAGLFGDYAMSPALERKEHEPSLAEMTQSALKNLDNQTGFFLMVEGSQIDWSSHDNDIVGTVAEMNDFAKAIQVALDYAQKDKETLVLITADHETGGLSVGARYDGENYYEFNVAPLRGITRSLAEHAKLVMKSKSLSEFLAESGIQLTKSEQQAFERLTSSNLEQAEVIQFLSNVINRATRTGWTTQGHTAVDVYVYAFGPGAEAFRGFNDNTKVGQTLHQWLELH